MKKLQSLLLTIGLCLSPQLSFADGGSSEEALPYSWFHLPEEVPQDGVYAVETAISSKAVDNIDRMMMANANALERMENRLQDRSYANSSKKDWRLAVCMFDISISASGMLGLLIAKGEFTAAMYWRKVAQDRVSQPVSADDSVDMSFSTADDLRNLDEQLEPLIQALLVTQKVQNEPALRANLKSTILQYHTVMQALTPLSETRWTVSRLRLDFEVTISGKVTPITTVGGGVKLRFEWLPKGRAPAIAVAKNGPGDSLKKLVDVMTKSLETVSMDPIANTGFKIQNIRLGLGIFGSGNFGVIKGGASLFGFLYLSPNRSYRGTPARTLGASTETFPLIFNDSNPSRESWASARGITYRTMDSEADGVRQSVYDVSVEGFRKGMERAVNMTMVLAQRAERNKRSWEIYQLKAEFALSVSGGTAFFTLGGTGDLELAFNK
ncbi:MAG: hypothetical protein HYR96_09545 [Deltaproteobacteria bacterium]|nr:hypothetical protein [Deltaproteobacteria bacterium]